MHSELLYYRHIIIRISYNMGLRAMHMRDTVVYDGPYGAVAYDNALDFR